MTMKTQRSATWLAILALVLSALPFVAQKSSADDRAKTNAFIVGKPVILFFNRGGDCQKYRVDAVDAIGISCHCPSGADPKQKIEAFVPWTAISWVEVDLNPQGN
jgi:hypothetical protein